eukprot:25014-Amphidinium_carterae.1
MSRATDSSGLKCQSNFCAQLAFITVAGLFLPYQQLCQLRLSMTAWCVLQCWDVSSLVADSRLSLNTYLQHEGSLELANLAKQDTDIYDSHHSSSGG